MSESNPKSAGFVIATIGNFFGKLTDLGRATSCIIDNPYRTSYRTPPSEEFNRRTRLNSPPGEEFNRRTRLNSPPGEEFNRPARLNSSPGDECNPCQLIEFVAWRRMRDRGYSLDAGLGGLKRDLADENSCHGGRFICKFAG